MSASFLHPTLEGPSLTLRPMRPDDFDAVYKVASDPLIWEQHPDSNRYQPEAFQKFFEQGIASGGALVATDRELGEVIGSSRYYEWDQERREIAIGFTFVARKYWGGPANRELKWLMLEHAFQWVDTVWFHVAATNTRSRRAMEKIGARLSHSDIRHMNDAKRETLFFKMEAGDVQRPGEVLR